MNVHVLAEAEAELEAARLYLESQAPGLGARFIEELDEAFHAIATRPLSFGKVETLPADQPYRRVLLSTFRYAVVFEVLDAEILVVAVSHGSREPNYWLGRLN